MATYRGISLKGFVDSRSIDAARAKVYAWARVKIFDAMRGISGTQAIYIVTKDAKYGKKYEKVGNVDYGGTSDSYSISWLVPDGNGYAIKYNLSPSGQISNKRRVRD